MFKQLFERVFYGGSYYDDLRVGKPDEFDLDLLLRFPKNVKYEASISNLPGYLYLKVINSDVLG